MENVKEWASKSYNYGFGDGSGYSDVDGSGYGDGYGSGSGYGYGTGYGYGSSDGYGFGTGYGAGESCGTSNSDGYGSDHGHGEGIKSINGHELFIIDGIPTAICTCRENVAKGFIFENFSLTPCYIVKDDNFFAHGRTLKEAEEALRKKILENMDKNEAIERFREHFKSGVKYKNSEFFEWHHYLTGSCRMGREGFCRNNDVDMDGESTPEYFIALTMNAYGGETIKKLKQYYKECKKG